VSSLASGLIARPKIRRRECSAVRAFTTCFDRVVALRAAAVNKEATLSAHTMSSGSPGGRLAGSSRQGRATQAMSITRDIPRFLLGVYLVVYLCSDAWANAMPHSSRADLQTPGAQVRERVQPTGRRRSEQRSGRECLCEHCTHALACFCVRNGGLPALRLADVVRYACAASWRATKAACTKAREASVTQSVVAQTIDHHTSHI
jgi:hypothetical protein